MVHPGCMKMIYLFLIEYAWLRNIECILDTKRLWRELFYVLSEQKVQIWICGKDKVINPYLSEWLVNMNEVILTLVSSHWWQVTGRGEMASSCTRVSSGWISGNCSLQKGLFSTGIDCPGRWLSHHPWMCLKTVWMWCSGTWRSGGLLVRVVWLGWGWIWWSLSSFPTSAILWFCDPIWKTLSKHHIINTDLRTRLFRVIWALV